MKTLNLQASFIGLILAAFYGLASGGTAVTPPQMPPGPALARLESAQWQVTISQEKEGTTDVSVVKVKSVVMKGNVRHEEIKTMEGFSLTIWCLGTDEFYKTSSSNEFFPCNPIDKEFYIVNSRQMFLELNWITSEKLIGTKSINGRPYMVFGEAFESLSAAKISQLLAPETVIESHFKKAGLSRIAYIDVESRLPLYFQEGAGTYSYQFQSAPSTPLVIPGEILAFLKMRQEQTKRLSQQPARS